MTDVRVIAIDGPAGSGKSTVGRALADEFGLAYLDTGAMYRAVTFAVLRGDIDPADADAVAELSPSLDIEIDGGEVRVDHVDATIEIRGTEVTRAVGLIARNPRVRADLRERQRTWARRHGGGVLEGRDIGSVVFPDALLRMYMTAAPEQRAVRRAQEMGDVKIGPDRFMNAFGSEPTMTLPGSADVILDSSHHTLDELVEEATLVVRFALANMREPTSATRGPVVAIDGEAGAGKSTLASMFAEQFELPLLDSGMLFRALAAVVHRSGDDLSDVAEVLRLARSMQIELRDHHILLDGADVSAAIRSRDVTALVPGVAAIPQVRSLFALMQRAWVATNRGGVVVGRDIGTVVLPRADLKVYLTADVEERARRRYLQDHPDAGDPDAEQLDDYASRIAGRDHKDRTRPVAPLEAAADAVVIDTTTLAPIEAFDLALTSLNL